MFQKNYKIFTVDNNKNMETKTSRLRYYINEYIGRVTWLKAALPIMVAILIITNYVEIKSSYVVAKVKPNDSTTNIISNITQYALLISLNNIFRYINNIFSYYFIATSIRSGLRNFFKEYLLINFETFQTIGIGQAQYSINRRGFALADFLTTISMYLISNIFFFILFIHDVYTKIDFWPFFVTLCMILSFAIVSILVQKYRAKVRIEVNDGFQRNSAKLYDMLMNYERIKAYDNTEEELSKYNNIMGKFISNSKIFWMSNDLVFIMNMLFVICLHVYLIKVYSRKNVPQEMIAGFVFVLSRLKEKVSDLLINIDEIVTSYTNLEQSEIKETENDEKSYTFELSNEIESIQMKNLGFNHNDKVILQDIDLNLSIPQRIAITGVNGGGKSTFLKILLGLYRYNGSYTINGIDAKMLKKKSIRKYISYVPQSTLLYDKTILDNLCLGNKELDDEKLVDMCKLYGYHELFKELGYNLNVGERGKNLSGGQRQKICFMRAILKEAPILLLDEATSNLDHESERKIIEHIRTHLKDKIVIMIVHNLTLLKNFDEIFYFDNKTIFERGTLDELLSNNSNFAKIYRDSLEES